MTCLPSSLGDCSHHGLQYLSEIQINYPEDSLHESPRNCLCIQPDSRPGIFFDENGSVARLKDYDEIFLEDSTSILLKLDESDSSSNFKRPFISISKLDTIGNYLEILRDLNASGKAVILDSDKHRRMLIESIILKNLLDMNEDLDLTLMSFRRGLEIQFPNPSVFEDNYHLIDEDIIKYFYEIIDYYHAFELEFDKIYLKY